MQLLPMCFQSLESLSHGATHVEITSKVPVLTVAVLTRWVFGNEIWNFEGRIGALVVLSPSLVLLEVVTVST